MKWPISWKDVKEGFESGGCPVINFVEEKYEFDEESVNIVLTAEQFKKLYTTVKNGTFVFAFSNGSDDVTRIPLYQYPVDIDDRSDSVSIGVYITAIAGGIIDSEALTLLTYYLFGCESTNEYSLRMDREGRIPITYGE